MQGRQVLVVDEAEVMGEAQAAMDRAGDEVGWRISLSDSRPPREPLQLRMPPTARSVRWAVRLGWQAIKEQIRSPERER